MHLLLLHRRVLGHCTHRSPLLGGQATAGPAPTIRLHHHCHCVTIAPTHCCRCHCRCCHYCRNHHSPLLLIPLLVGYCVVVRRPLSSSRAVMQLSTLSLPAAFADNCLPLPPPPPPTQLPLPPSCHHRATATTMV